MTYLIQKLFLKNVENYEFSEVREANELDNLSKINIFVGSNNSGKSRYVRNIFDQSSYSFIPTNLNIGEVNSLFADFRSEILSTVSKYGVIEYGSIVSESNKFKELKYIEEKNEYILQFLSLLNELSNLKGELVVTSRSSYSFHSYSALNSDINNIAAEYLEKFISVVKNSDRTYKFKKVYIPALRGLRPFDGNHDHYLSRTINDYFPELNNNESIFTGLNLYEEVKKLLLGDLISREIIADFQKFLGDMFFDGQSVALIPSYNSDVLYVKIGKEKERPIFGLGDGIQSIIILTFPLFLNRAEEMLVFIEEPELYLHPGLQRKLIETFMSFGNFQYFITTHSNHFLDLTLDINQISIYFFRKHFGNQNDETEKEATATFIIENTSNEDNSILELIGVRNSSVFLSNCTIWVEGITDRFYLRHYLKLYMEQQNGPQYKEDLHYSFVEYSGGNITHWSFLDEEGTEEQYRNMNAERLCSKLFLITDKDSEAKLERQRKLKQKLGRSYYCLNCKEIENSISKKVLLKVVAGYEGKDESDLTFRNNNFTERDYKDQYIGEFIQSNLLHKQRRGSYKDKSGTISDKVGFCKRAIEHTKSFDDLSSESKKLVKKIYEFIVERNK